MRNFTSHKLRIVLLLGFFLLCLTTLQAQVTAPFTMKKKMEIKGDIAMIGNNIVNRKTDPYTYTTGSWGNWTTHSVTARNSNDAFPTGNEYINSNDNYNMRYIDVDGDAATFSSSSATLTLPDLSCTKVVYAALYWSATYRFKNGDGSGGREAFNTVKLKLPGASSYTAITGSTIFDGHNNALWPALDVNSPYACYADVTTLLQGLANPNGSYTVADIHATEGTLGGGGISGGWNLFVIYENLTFSGKYIASFDGFAGVNSGLSGGVPVTYSGFTTVPAPLTVNAKLATAGLEGDYQINGDRLKFQSGSNPVYDLSSSYNPANNFFNANITVLTDDTTTAGVYDETVESVFTARTPASTNTLGFDCDVIRVPANYIPNGATSATLTMTTSQDTYFMYFNALAIDVIEPEVTLLKTVEDDAQNNIGGTPVTLGAYLTYVLTVENVGNDHAVGTTITDVLPVNTTYVSTDLSNVPGATATPTYDPVTGRTTVVITVPDALLKKKGTPLMVPRKIKIRVKVAETCNELTDMCENKIENKATIAYHGFENSNPVGGNSITGGNACGGYVVGPANFLVDVDDCLYSRTEILCGSSLVLTAGSGYIGYEWFRENGATDIPLGTTQSITVTTPGQYYVKNDAAPPCVDITENITVSLDSALLGTNPIAVAGVADKWGLCANEGRVTAIIALCGLNDSRLIPSGVTTGTISWQKLNSGPGCNNVLPDFCPHNAVTCESSWIEVATGPNFTVTDKGEYRLRLDNGGCHVEYYFKVTKNDLNPKVDVKDIVCTTPGEITVVGVPAGYEYRLLTQAGAQLQPTPPLVIPPATQPVATYVTNPTFPIATTGVYKIELREVGVTDGCLFEIPNIGVAQKNLTLTVTPTDKTCSVNGTINIQALGVNAPYTYKLTGPGGVVLTYGPTIDNSHMFTGLANAGSYSVLVTTADCSQTATTTLVDNSQLNLIASVSQHISCSQGNIQMNASGGKTPYSYAIYSYNGVLQSPLIYQTSVIFDIPIGMQGDYVFIMKDGNGCTKTSNPVTINLVPDVVFTSTVQNVLCNGQANGSISINVTNANGYNVSFSLVNSSGTVIATSPSGSFTGLAPGNYTVMLFQTKGNRSCDFSFPYTITQPTAITAGAPTVTQQYTCSTTATIYIDPTGISGGTAPYTYSINGTTYGASSTFTGLTAGTYTVKVKDASGCVLNATPITIPALTPPTDLAFSATPISCPAPTSTVTLTTTGGSGALNYQITAPSTVNNGTSNVFSGLAPGTYMFRVTDAKGCSYQESFTINAITPMSVVGTKVNDARCFGSATGAITFKLTGYLPGYNYTVVSTGTVVPAAMGLTTDTVSLTNLAAGTYTITVTNPTTGCTATAAVTINNPTAALAVTKTVTQPDCTVTTGSLAVTATNGWGGYSYTLTTGATTIGPVPTPNFQNLAAGNYTLTVTDANGCIFTDTFTITVPVPPVLTVTGADVCLPGTSIAVEVTSGTGLAPFQYSINGGAYTNGTTATGTTYTNLAPNTYTITVKDANGCTNAAAVTRTINPQLTATTALVKGLTCSVPTQAQIAVTINGGGASYQYQVSYNAGAYSAATTVAGSFTYNAAAAGTYQFQITDAAGCIVTTVTRTIAPITSPQFTFGTSTAVKCYGDNTGALTVNITPGFGTAPYTVAVTNTTTSTPYGTQTSMLPAGNYSVTVTDANGCTATNTTTISQPTAPIAYAVTTKDITCNNPNTSFGEITVQGVTGGTAPYTYYVSNNFGTNLTPFVASTGQNHTFIVVNFGIYTVNVVDANGCSLIKTNYVIASPPNDLTIDVTTPTADCLTGGTVVVTVTAAVLSNNYEFGILTQNTPPYSTAYQPYDAGTPTIKTFTGLTPGVTYTFVVHDLVTNCYYFKTATGPVPTLSAITSTATPTPVTCTGAADGKVSFTMSGYSATTTEVSYQIFHYPSTLPITPTPITGSITGLTGAPATVNNVGNLAPGDYYILFTEVDGSVIGCSKTSPVFKITESTLLLQASAVVTKNDNCNTNAGIITASAQYGTAPYSYQLVPAANPAPTAGTWAGQASPIFNAEGGTYIVYVKDANNCIQPTPANVVLPTDVSPALTAVLAPGTQCTTAEGSFVIDVTRTNNGSLGPFLYSLDGAVFEPQGDVFSYTGLMSGTHTVQIMDINGCTMAAPLSITIYAPIGVTAQPTVQPTCPANVGTITAVGTGGSAPANLRYELQTTAGASVAGPQASAVFTGIVAGSYKVVISDTASSCTAEAAVTLDATVPVTFSAVKDDVNCVGGTDGSITITLPNTNTDIPYTYTIDGALSAALTQTQPVFTNLVADTYTVTVTSGKGCTATQTVTITAPTAVVAGASVTTPFACAPDNTVNTATVTVTGTGGTPTYTYSIDGINYTTTNTFAVASTGAAQNITAYVKDSNGCIDDVPLTINPLPVITSATAVLTTDIDCNLNQGVVTVTAAGGSGDFTFTMLPSGTPVNTALNDYDQTFTITEPGVYTFEIKDDVTGCTTIVSTVDIPEYDVIDAVATASTPVVCFGSSTGSVTVDVQNYSGAYNYEVFNGATSVATGTGNTSTNPFTITGLPSGNLFVKITATAAPFCSADTSIITVDSPADPLVPNAAMTFNATCTDNMGEITAQATGGWGSYQYELVDATSAIIQPYSATNVFTGLAAGNYTVNIKDSGNCIVSQNVNLPVATPIAATIAATPTALPCYGDTTASVTATASGGQGTYEYILNTYNAAGTTIVISTDAQPSPVFTGLGAGKYSITVVDGWSCGPLETAQVTITQPAQLQGYLSQTTPLACTTPAQITISASGGTAPYYYSTDGGTTFDPFTAGTVFTVTAGTYSYLVRDANGCTAVLTNEVEVAPIEPIVITLDLDAAQISCAGSNNAVINASATGGLGNYQYTLTNNDNAATITNTTGVFSGLADGHYQVSVISGDCNATSPTVTEIVQPTTFDPVPVVTNVQCFGVPTGSINITTIANTTDGTGPIQYAISPNLNQFVDTPLFTGLWAGTYTVIAQDARGCFEVFNITITQPDQIESEITIHSDETCLGEGDGTIDIHVYGGSPPYVYSLDNYATFTTILGTYNAVTGVDYQINGLAPGIIKVWVRDANGCSISPELTQEIKEGVNLAPQVAVTEVCSGNAPNNNVTISVTLTGNPAGSPANVTYSIDGATWFPAASPTATSYTFNNVSLPAGTYTAYAKHTMPGPAPVADRECVQTVPFTIAVHNAIAATAVVSTPITCNAGTGTVTINVTASTGALQYAMGPAFTFGSSNAFSGLTAGTYDFKVKDALGCELNITGVVVSEPTAITAAVSGLVHEICLGDNGGAFTITPSGGTPNYQVSIDGGTTFTALSPSAVTFNSRPADDYTIVIKDANNCIYTMPAPVTINPGVDLQAAISAVQVCNTTTITLSTNPAIATTDLTYSLDGGAAQAYTSTPIPLTGLTAGSHSVIITHSNGCPSTPLTFNVAPLVPIVMGATSKTDVSCFGGTNGTATVTVTGGTAPLTYAIAPNVLPLTFGTYQSTATFTGLAAGSYVINVKDAIGCESASATITVGQPAAALAATATSTNEICINAGDGTITVTPTNGTGPYQARINGGAYTATFPTSHTFTALAPGNYTVDVRDANGCTYTITPAITITPGVDLVPSVNVDPYCQNNVIHNIVLISDNVFANIGQVEFSVDGLPFKSDGDYSDLAPGPHTATVRHNNGCQETISFTVPALLPISPAVPVVTNVNCFGDATGAITVTATGGTGTLSYAIADADVLPLVFGTPQATGAFTGLTAGNYVVSILDDNLACETQVTATLTEPAAALTATIGAQTDVLCFGNATGSATVNVTGGTGVYGYSWNTTPVQTTATATGLTAGTYTVTVTDANGCTTTQSFTITQPAAALTATIGAQTDVLCFGNATGSATVNVTGGTGVYSYSWNTTPVQTTATATGLTAGTYTVTVTDANGCTTTQSFTITQPAAALTATIGAQTDVLCFGNATGAATVNVTGGTGAYGYSWNTTPVQTTATATGLTAGTYTVTVTDANGCTTTQSFTITQPAAALTATIGAQTDVLCFGNATGSATVNVTGGTGVYSYSWNTTPVQTTATATGLTAGTYAVTVTDANGCTTTQSFTITQPSGALTATIGAQTNVLCFGNATGSATVNVTGGTGVYSYSWDTTPVQTTATISSLTAGTYTVTVTDANGCTTTQSFTITQPAAALVATAGTQTNVLCFGNATGSATVNVTGGTGVYSYSWNTTPVQTTATATGLTAGTYTVTVTDANGCTTTQSFTITQPAAALIATAGSRTDVLCFGNATGSATVNVTGGTGAYSYSWNTTPVQTTATATGLTAGTYTVTVTDANGCTATQSFTITQPAAALTATIGAQTNVLCFGNATGVATVNVTGGTGAYSYSWDTTPVQTTATISSLTAGTYTVTVTDANGCTTTQSFTITQPAAALVATVGVQTNVLCFGNATGSATVNVTGGTGVYSYSWNTTPVQTTATATGLTAGTYTVTVTDANGCTTTQSFTITQPAAALVATVGVQTNVLCFGNATGSATVNVTGGTGAYSYSWNTTPVQTTATATGLTAGTYTVTVTDANGCTATQSFTITQPAAALTATIGTQTNVLCFGNATGVATVNVTGGTGAYSYSWNTAPVQTTATATGLTAGTYTVTVTDANGCTTTQSFTITQPAGALAAAAGTTQTNVLCFGNATGSATIVATGGTAPYTYNWSTTPVQTAATATGLTAGTYTVTVTDANGCNISQSFTITQPAAAIVATAGAQTNVLCFGNATGSATVNVTGGTGVYSYSWNTTPVQTTATATGLTAGTYSVTVTDANGCSATVSYTITQPATALSATVAHTDESCLNDSNGTITVTPSGGVGLYEASLNGGAFTAATPSIVFNGLAGGNYTIQVRDANGCIFNAPSTTVITGIVIGATVTTTQECNEADIVVSVNASVVGQVTYSLDGGTPQASNEFNNVILNPAVPHTVTVTHVQGCSETPPSFMIAPVVPIVLNSTNVNVTNIACHGKDVGSIVVNATGGTGPLQYAITWNIWTTAFYGPSNTFNDLLAGDYVVHVKDAMGCIQSLPVTITEPAEELILAAAVGQHESCIGAHDGSIDVTLVQGGTPPYSIAVDSPQNFQPYDPAVGADFAGLYGRTLPYEIYVRDASGCYAKAIVTIQKGVSLVPGLQTVLSCVNNAPVNTVTATLNTIVDNVEYKLETATGTLIQDFSPVHTWTLAPGNYIYTVRHINGCQKTYPFTVQPRVPITVTSVIPTDAACNGGTDGTLTVTATGGTGNLQYGISPDYVMTSNPVFTGLAAGTYTVRVQDQYGCYVEFSNFPPIGEPAVLVMTETMNLPEVCVDDNNGAFEIDITGGTAPYATSLDANGTFVTDQTLFENLDGGTYTVYIQDAKGCTMTQDVTLISPLDIDAKAEVVYNCDLNTVTIITNGAINPGELNYSIVGPKDGNNPPQTSNIFANLEDGTYTVEVINTVTGCTDVTEPFKIISVPDLAISLSMSGLNQFTATVMGGEGPYQYTLNGDSNGSKNVFTYFRSGKYVVTVTDSRGCTKDASIEVNFVDIILPDVVTPDDDGQNDTWSPGNTANYPNINSFVFDRYGRKLATLRQGDTWDGTYDGHPMPTGDYWYLVELGDADGRSFVGHFTIYR